MKANKNWLEWSVFGLGLVLVCGTLGYLLYDAIFQNAGPPKLELAFGKPEELAGHYAVPVTIHNRGGHTAEQVLVRVTLTIEGKKPESAEFQVAYVPRHSDRQGFVTFKSDPRKGKLSGRAIGYEQP